MSVLYIHLLIETMLQNFPSMSYRQPTSTPTVQISAEPPNKFLNPKYSSKIITSSLEAIYTAVQSGNCYVTEKSYFKEIETQHDFDNFISQGHAAWCFLSKQLPT